MEDNKNMAKSFYEFVTSAFTWIGSSRTRRYFLNANATDETGYPYSSVRFFYTLAKIEKGLLNNEMTLEDTNWDISQYDLPQFIIDAMNIKKVWISVDFRDRNDKLVAEGPQLLKDPKVLELIKPLAKMSETDKVMNPEEWVSFWANFNENQKDADHPALQLVPVTREYFTLIDFKGIRKGSQMYEINKSGSVSKELSAFAGVELNEGLTGFLKSGANVNDDEVKAWVISQVRSPRKEVTSVQEVTE